MRSLLFVLLATLGVASGAGAAQAPAKARPAGEPRPAPAIAPSQAVRLPANLQARPAPAARVQLSREQFEQLKRSQQQARSEALARVGKLVLPATTGKPAPATGAAKSAWTHKYGQGRDCDDRRADVHPNAVEVCDNVDNDCDGEVDEGQRLLFFLDADGDTHGDPAQSIEACPADQQRAAREGRWLVPVGNDCDDTDPDLWQGCP